MQVNLNLSPSTNVTPHDVKIDGNAVGMTLYCAAGTTLSGEVVAVGY